MAVEQAIVSLVVQGSAEAVSEADRVAVKLGSVQEAGERAADAAKSASEAAKEAEAQARALSSEIRGALSLLSRVAHTARRVAQGFGVERHSRVDRAIAIVGEGLMDAALGARLGSAFGPVGTVIGAGAGGLLGEYTAYARERDWRKKQERKAEEKGRKSRESERDEEIEEALLRQVGLYKLDQHTFGPRQVP